MNCPKCTGPVAKLGRYCARCGHDFGEEIYERLSFYFGLKDEFEQFSQIQNSLSSGLGKLSVKLQQYEEMLRQDLEKAAASLAGKSGKAAGPVPQTPEAVMAATGSQARTPPAEPEDLPMPPPLEPERRGAELEVHLGQKWLLIVGILTMVFGVGYFLKYSFEQGWVTPAGRVAMAYVWGIVFLVGGDRFRKKELAAFGLSLTGGGIAVLYFAAFAAFQIYQLFDQTSSFAVMVLITVLAGTLSVFYDAKWLAVLGLAGGFLTPLLLSTGRDNQVALMTYMTILNLGLLGIAFYKKWDLLNTLGLIFTYLLYSGWFARHYADHKFWPAVIFVNIFYLIYSVAPFAYQFVREGGEEKKGINIMVPNSFIAFGYSYVMVRDHFSLAWVSVISIFYAVVFLSMASYLYQKGRHGHEGFAVLLGKALLFLIITVPLIFSKHWITIFWSAQAVALLWMGTRLDRRGLINGAYALLGLALFKFLLYDYGEVFHFNLYNFAFSGSYTYLLLERWVTTFVVLVSLVKAGDMAGKASSGVLSEQRNDSAVISAAMGIFLFIALNLETAAFFHDYLIQARFAAVSVLWTLFSVALMLLGFRKNSAAVRKVSFTLFSLTVLKVFFFDMANFSTPYRIISFIILGLMLVGTSYLYYKYKDRIISVIADDREEHTR